MQSPYRFDEENHLHTYEGKPLTGTSSVVKVIAKPLTWWASGLAVEKFGWKNPKKVSKEICENAMTAGFEKVKALDFEGYKALVNEAYRAHSVNLTESAEAGTDLHAELEKFVKNTMDNRLAQYEDRIMPFILWAKANVKKFLWSEMHCFSEKAWTGGIADAGAELNDGNIALIDFKSSKEAYTSHFIQIGGYDLQISANGGYTAEGEKVFELPSPITQHIVVPFGAKEVLPVINRDVETNKEGFKHCLGLYRTLNKMDNL